VSSRSTEGVARITPPQEVTLASEAKLTLAVAGIRGGKTHVGALATILRAIRLPTEEDQCHAVASPTFPMSKWGPEAKLQKLLRDRRVFPVSPLIDYAKSDRCFYLANEAGSVSKIRIFSGDDPDRWRGDSWLSWWGDEAARLTKQAWDVGIGRLADTDGPALFTTTPDGHNFLFDLAAEATVEAPGDGFIHRVSEDGRVRLVSWASTSNVFLKNPGAFEDLRARYDPDTYAQEVEAQFVARSGRVYRHFDRKRHVRALPVPSGSALVVYVGQDFNVERMASVFAFDTGTGLHIFDEMEIRDADTFVLVKRLDAWCAARGLARERVTVVPDASGKKRQTGANRDTARTDLEILQRAGFRVRGPKANPAVRDRVNSVNSLLWTARLTLDPRCALTIEALEKQPWGKDGGPEKDGVLDNRVDALGYVVWHRYPLRQARATLGTTDGE
jgi:hypothetical protein